MAARRITRRGCHARGPLSLVGYSLRSIGGTPVWLINHDYHDSQGRAVPNALQYTHSWANNSYPGSAPSDDGIRLMIMSRFGSKYPPSNSTSYAAFTGTTVNLGGNFGSGGYCAYRNKFSYFNGISYVTEYVVMPHASSAPSCTPAVNGCNHTPNADVPADIVVSPLSHLLEETVTDPRLNAWYDSAHPGQENADTCDWTWGTRYAAGNGSQANVTVGSTHFLIQRNWKFGPVRSTQIGCAMK